MVCSTASTTATPCRPKNRDSVVFYAEADARGFIDLAGQLGLATALAVTKEPDEHAATAIIARAREARAPRMGLLRTGTPAPAAQQPATPAASADPRMALGSGVQGRS